MTAPAHAPARPELRRGPFLAAAGALIAIHAAMLVALASVTPWTVDEPNYLAAGMAIRRHFEFEAFSTILHGPLTFLANQLFLPDGLQPTPADLIVVKLQARLGMIVFSLLCALVLTGFARAAFGRRVALVALLLHVANPTVLGHGCLLTADMPLTACYLLTAAAAWGYLRRPAPWRLLQVGIALGLGLATKYLALFLLPALGLTALCAVATGFRPGLLWSRQADASVGRRLADLLPATAIVAVVAGLTLHTCYLWRAGGYQVRPPRYEVGKIDPQDPEAGPLSEAFRAAVQVPGVPAVLSVLPAPFVRGVDYQKYYSEQGGISYFDRRLGPGFAGYFVTALAVKQPLPLSLLLLLGLLCWRAPPWPHRLPVLLLWLVVIPLVYLSLFTVLQIGVRYLLPVFPLLALVAARPAAWLLPSRLGRAVLLGLGAWLVLGTALAWPHYVGYFNALAGDRPYLLYRDSNLEWRHQGWAPDLDGQAMAARAPGSQVIYAQSGPRFGRLRAPGHALTRADARNQQRSYHWLQRFHPIDSIGSWYLFDIDEAGFRAAVGAGTPEADPRGLVDLAIALVGDRRADAALALLEGSTDPDAPKVRQAARLLKAGRDRDPALLQALLELGRYDLVLAWPTPVPDFLQAFAHFHRHEYRQAREVLENAERSRRLQLHEAMLLASCLQYVSEPEDALEVLRRYHPPEQSPVYGTYQDLVRRLEQDTRALRLVERKATRPPTDR